MYTSNFANYIGNKGISICKMPPLWFFGEEYKDLAPKNWMAIEYRRGAITQEEYIELYRAEVLSKLDPKKVYNDLLSIYGKDFTLLCWCGKDKFCHRHIVAEWLNNELGTQIVEL